MYTSILIWNLLETSYFKGKEEDGRIKLRRILGNRLSEWEVDGTGSGHCPIAELV
jgi:hypothetical protein